MGPITPELSIKEILQQYPETLPVFVRFGFTNFSNRQIIDTLGSFLKLRTLLKHSTIDQSAFIQQINLSVTEQQDQSSFFCSGVLVPFFVRNTGTYPQFFLTRPFINVSGSCSC